ncbi:hypothetical protein [Demequina lignilytica]|uniref:Secreted protein n=1 Tax=Demequina lignilytica TaxID=3051663 RepID=A0AB35MGS6_9MICO|nr:hypothetical protein [Demequina sp. SYSU T0a273]MDN4482959.1 hypothetical protein [Demequina sp. SYSU T0a273]
MALSRPVMIGAAVAVLAAGAIGTVAVIAATLPTEPVSRTVDASGTAELPGGACVDWTLEGTLTGEQSDIPTWMLWEAAAGGAEVDAALSDPQLLLDVHDVCGEAGGTASSQAELAWTVSRSCEDALATDESGTVSCDGDARRLIASGHASSDDAGGAIGQIGSSIRGEDLPIGVLAAGEGDLCFDLFVALTLYRDTGSDTVTFTATPCA